MWNFDAKQCTQMRKAEFDCSFDGFFAQLEKLRITPTEKLEKGRAGDPRPAMIVGCGESENKKTVLIQWFIPPEGTAVDCNLDVNEGLITTGCYGENSGQSTTDEEEKKRIVLNCMNGLAQ